ncbi:MULTISPECIES: membrane integrity-associated transporter subunit PqiC [unclassified Paludibacterium]|uniref:PqiC family protein n=1 Tax=unclassified Paludibacterium TaxID=2618429 RepID=UPI001C05C0DB|nr:ABC-type transport auxiliary lipoprotein family protein [Paludibacterium sp. B53371]BEV71493.1 hypothetical protein THUN1379_09750 [Paludibacterium sp. THUN1379]
MNRILALWLCLLLFGCASAPVHYYRLPEQGGTEPPSRSDGPTLQIGPVSLPGWLNRPQLQQTGADGQVHFLPQAEWAAPLANLLALDLARQLGRSLVTAQVRAWPSASPLAADWQVALDVLALDAGRERLQLDARWQILHAGQPVGQGRLTRSFALSGQDATALVLAHEQASAALAAAIAESLRPFVH